MLANSSAGSTAVNSSTTTSQAAKAQQDTQAQLNQFLNMLVTQLKNQDPLNPMDANQFTSQLVQFSSVEQQIYANANLEKLVSLQQTSQTSFMIDYIGKTVEATGDKVMLDNGQAEFNYILDTNAANVQVTIQDSSGRTVFTAAGETAAGKHNILWDGKDNTGVQHADGPYSIVVAATDRDGKLQNVTQTVVGKIVGAGNDNGKPTLFMGEILTPMESVISVRETPPTTQTAGTGADSTN